MKITLRLLGREVLALDVGHPPAGQLEPDEPAAPAAEEAPFGFWGGAGGQQEHNWQHDVQRPMEADR